MTWAETFRASAHAYDLWVGRYGPSLAPQLIEFAGVEPGMRALDVGCGPGALTAALVGRLGAEFVTAVDPSESFAAACRARLPGVAVHQAPAERLPFGDGAFDVVLSQLVLNFLDDAAGGVAEMRRVTRPGGVVAACVWDYAGEMTMLRAFWDAAIEVDGERATMLDEGRRFSGCNLDALASLWVAGDLDDVEAAPLVVSAQYGDFEDLWSPLIQGVGPAGAYCAALDDATRDALRAELHRRLGSPDGPFELTARAWAVRGVVA